MRDAYGMALVGSTLIRDTPMRDTPMGWSIEVMLMSRLLYHLGLLNSLAPRSRKRLLGKPASPTVFLPVITSDEEDL